MAGFRFRLELCELEIQFLAFENGLGKGKDGYSRLSMLDCFAGFWDKVSSCLLDGYSPPPSIGGTGTETLTPERFSRFGGFNRTSPFDPVSVFTVSREVHVVSFSANRNPLLRDFFHWNLLIISFIGGVQWNKALGPPAVMSHLIEGGGVVGSVKTGRINAQPLGCPVHRKASSDTIVTGAFGHHKISRQFGGVKGAATVELVKAMTVDKGISMGIIADGWLFGIIVAFAVTVFLIAMTDLLAISIAMHL